MSGGVGGKEGNLRQNQSSVAPTHAGLGLGVGQEEGPKFLQKKVLGLRGKGNLENAKGLNTHTTA